MTEPIIMSFPGELRLREDGIWAHDGEPVTHAGIAKYFTRHLTYSARLGGWTIEDRGKSVSVTVADTPYFVESIELGAEWRVTFDDDLVEPLDVGTLELEQSRGLSCRRRDGFAAKFKRNAAQQLFPFIDEQDGKFVVRHPDGAVIIPQSSRPPAS